MEISDIGVIFLVRSSSSNKNVMGKIIVNSRYSDDKNRIKSGDANASTETTNTVNQTTVVVTQN